MILIRKEDKHGKNRTMETKRNVSDQASFAYDSGYLYDLSVCLDDRKCVENISRDYGYFRILCKSTAMGKL